MDLCKNAISLNCSLRYTCRRSTTKPEKKQKYINGDFWHNECRLYAKENTDEELREQISDEKREFYNDNKAQ
jgi:hypothetical protein